MLHFTNAYEDGDEIVLDGFFQGDPEPVDNRIGNRVGAGLPLPRPRPACRPGCTAGGSTCVTGATTEEQLSDSITEFGMINARLRGPRTTATPTPPPASPAGSCSTDWSSTTCRPAPRSGSPSATASTAARPRWRRGSGSTGEDDGYLVTLTTDMNDDASYCLVFDAARVADGPVCKLRLPERISSGTHSTWAAGVDAAALAQPTTRPPRSGCRWQQPEPNAVARMLGLLGDEWTLLIIQQALMGATRYGEFQAAPADLELGADQPAAVADATTGCCERRVYQTNPPAPST